MQAYRLTFLFLGGSFTDTTSAEVCILAMRGRKLQRATSKSYNALPKFQRGICRPQMAAGSTQLLPDNIVEWNGLISGSTLAGQLVVHHQGGCRTGASAVMPEMVPVGRPSWFQ